MTAFENLFLQMGKSKLKESKKYPSWYFLRTALENELSHISEPGHKINLLREIHEEAKENVMELTTQVDHLQQLADGPCDEGEDLTDYKVVEILLYFLVTYTEELLISNELDYPLALGK